MKIEHITLGGTAKIRHTNDIAPATKKFFAPTSWEYKSQTLTLPGLTFSLKISAAEEGAIFDIQKDGMPAIMNVCCFGENSDLMLSHIHQVADVMKTILPGNKFNVLQPVTPHWLYSIVVNPIGLSGSEISTAGEIELYVYERLFEAWKNRKA